MLGILLMQYICYRYGLVSTGAIHLPLITSVAVATVELYTVIVAEVSDEGE